MRPVRGRGTSLRLVVHAGDGPAEGEEGDEDEGERLPSRFFVSRTACRLTIDGTTCVVTR